MRKTLLALTLALCFPATLAAEGQPMRLRPLNQQEDLNCKIEGFTAALLAQRRDNRLTRSEALFDVTNELDKLDNADEASRLSDQHAKSKLRMNADLVYDLPDLKPKTMLYLVGGLCAIITAGSRDSEDGAKLILEAHRCQALHPLHGNSRKLDNRDEPTIELQSCMGQAITSLFYKR